jgi:SNF2 family DNA or RNA helicase
MQPSNPPRLNNLPRPGLLARVRNRLAIVSDVRADSTEGDTEQLVDLTYVDQCLPSNDSVVWSLEPQAAIIPPEGFPKVLETSPMRQVDFEALKRSVRWGALNCFWSEALPDSPIVAPFLGGVQVEDYQLIPLARALSMPRVTLALFDDVGLGKTVEAGLVIGELIRRRRIRRILVLCPAWLRKQWQDELESKFGLDFTLVDRDSTVQLRRQLGMETNPWTTHPRSIASYHYLKQEDVLSEFLLASQSSGPNSTTLPWDLLIIDEVHNCMPAANGKDSELAHMLERIGKLFEHKVFLSATPHNGFTQSFTGLLSLLDPVRFTKKDSITAIERRRVSEVVVRRLKKDINKIDEESGKKPRFVERILQPALILDYRPEESSLVNAFELFRTEFKRIVGGSQDPATRIAGNFVIEVLSKRLLSCPYTFAVSWSRFRQGLSTDDEASTQSVRLAANEAKSEMDRDDEFESKLNSATRLAGAWSKRELSRLRPCVDQLELALNNLGLISNEDGINIPKSDARLESLLKLIKEDIHGGNWEKGERLIVFTEYRTTLDYLLKRINDAFPNEPEGRFLQLYGGMPDSQRESIKHLFNDPRSQVRVLFATDAASEGANLQETARMILHYDFPWNPSRVDQRNGRLDRHGQSRDVLVYHFTSDSDSDMRFLHRLFLKLETIREELGSMGKLFDEAIQQRFLVSEKPTAHSLFDDEEVIVELDKKTEVARRKQRADLESTTDDGKAEQAALQHFREVIDLNGDTLRETLEVAVATSGEPFQFLGPEVENRYRMSSVPSEFRHTINSTLRRQSKDGSGSLLSVQFAAEDQLVQIAGRKVHRPAKDTALLHLGHPFVRQSLQALSVCRFPGSKRHGVVSRWTVTQGALDPGVQAIVSVCVEELAINQLRETFHQWVTVLRFPVSNGDLGKLLPYITPAEERSSAKIAPDRVAEAKAIWAEIENELQGAVRKYSKDLNAKLSDQLQREKKKAEKHQLSLIEERKEALARQMGRDISAKRRELEELQAQINDLSLFTDVDDSRKIDEARIKEAMESEQSRLFEAVAFLESEHARMMEHVIPGRYALVDAALVYPVSVEIRLPEVR